MIKFSIIIPVYNVEKYIKDCLESVLIQTYDNFEVIVVNDGSTDNSQDIIDKYVKKDKRIKSFIKKNGGLSDARNYGVSKCNGDYIVFLDSDDTINKDLLRSISDNLKNDEDIVRFQINKISTDNEYVDCSDTFVNVSGEEAFKRLIKNSWFVTAVSCAYKTNFWKENNFLYPLNRTHEDFGLTPYVYMKSGSVTAIDYVGYNYYFRENSITTSKDESKIIKRCNDCLANYDDLLKMIENDNISEYGLSLYKSYISNSLITFIKIVPKDELKKYLNELKKRNIGDNLIDDTFIRKIKKMIYKFNPKLYVLLFVK